MKKLSNIAYIASGTGILVAMFVVVIFIVLLFEDAMRRMSEGHDAEISVIQRAFFDTKEKLEEVELAYEDSMEACDDFFEMFLLNDQEDYVCDMLFNPQ